MGGAKKVDARKYVTQPDSSRDLAIMFAMQQAQAKQQATQGELLKAYADMSPEMQQYDAGAESRRLAELGMANVQRSREMEQMVSPEAAKMRQEQGAELARLASMDNAAQYMNEWARNQGLIQGYETGLGNSTVGQAATYDAALKAKANYDQQNLALQQEVLRQMQAPVGGIDPSTSISAQEAAKAANLQAMQNWQNAMYGNIGGYNQSVADQMAQIGAGFQGINQTARQNALNYRGALLGQQAQNAASNAAMTGAYTQAAGSALGGITGGLAQRFAPVGASALSKGTNPAGEYQYAMNAVPKATAV